MDTKYSYINFSKYIHHQYLHLLDICHFLSFFVVVFLRKWMKWATLTRYMLAQSIENLIFFSELFLSCVLSGSSTSCLRQEFEDLFKNQRWWSETRRSPDFRSKVAKSYILLGVRLHTIAWQRHSTNTILCMAMIAMIINDDIPCASEFFFNC